MKVDFAVSQTGSPLSPRRIHVPSQKINSSSLFGPFVLLGAAGWFGGSELDAEVEPRYDPSKYLFIYFVYFINVLVVTKR